MKTVYFILGMHRSGTSALGGVFSNIGLDFGTDLMRADEGNPKGYYENNLIYELNERILQESNSSWDEYHFSVEKIEKEQKVKYIKKAKKIIKAEFRYSEIFAIKDPRICLLFPIWEEACKKLNIDISILDEEYYLSKNLDLKEYEGTSYEHYYQYGKHEGRKSNQYCEFYGVDVTEEVSQGEIIYQNTQVVQELKKINEDLYSSKEHIETQLHLSVTQNNKLKEQNSQLAQNFQIKKQELSQK